MSGWLQTYESTLSIRLAIGLAIFAGLLAWDLARHGRRSPRLAEYGFLVFATLLAVEYAVLHDQITATISPEYFLVGKGLSDDPRPFRLAVTLLAARASYSVGLVAGALLLVANNPSPRRPRLPYRKLIRLSLLPLALAPLAAAVCGLAARAGAFGLTSTAATLVGPQRARPFALVWGVHAGSYLGAAAGALLAIALVVKARRFLAASPSRENARGEIGSGPGV